MHSIPENEAERLEALRAIAILNTERTPEFDAIVEAIAEIFDCPIGLVSLVDDDYQWFKARCGIDLDGTPMDVAFCNWTIRSASPLVVPDATKDPRFCDNPLVTGDPYVRFYAGCPVSIDGVHRLGALCVVDYVPRQPSEAQMRQLCRLATAVEGLIRSHAHALEVTRARSEADRLNQKHRERLALLEDVVGVAGVGGWQLDMKTRQVTWTRQTRQIHEVAEDYQPTLETALAFYPPEARTKITEAIGRCQTDGAGWDLEVPFRTATGCPRWVHAVGRVIVENDEVCRLVGAIRDVTPQKAADLHIRRSGTLYKSTLEALTEGILVLGRGGQICSYNPAACRILGLSAEQLATAHIGEIARLFGPDTSVGGEQGNPFLRVLEAEEAKTATLSLCGDAETSQRWLTINVVRIAERYEDGEAAMVVSLTDITDGKRQADMLAGVFENFPGGVVFFDRDMCLQAYNEEFKQLLDLPDEFLAQKPDLEAYFRFNVNRSEYGEGEADTIIRERVERLCSGEAHSYERVRPDGTVLEIKGTPVPDGGLVLTFADITERKQTERRYIENERIAREKSTELEITLANMNQGVSVFDGEGRLVLWNRQYIDLFEMNPEEAWTGAPLTELVEAKKARGDFQGDVAGYVADLRARLQAGEVVRVRFHLGCGRTVLTVHAPLPDGGWIGTHEDVTEQDKASERILHAAHHDTLTGLANRSLFNRRLEDAVADAAGGTAGYALMLLDLDRFKAVNDTYGHGAGDALLEEVARRLRKSVRETDLVARFGGDEFAVILEKVEDRELAGIAGRIIETLGRAVDVGENLASVGVSLGIARMPTGASDIRAVMRNADAALYQVKQEGGNGYRVFHPKETKAL